MKINCLNFPKHDSRYRYNSIRVLLPLCIAATAYHTVGGGTLKPEHADDWCSESFSSALAGAVSNFPRILPCNILTRWYRSGLLSANSFTRLIDSCLNLGLHASIIEWCWGIDRLLSERLKCEPLGIWHRACVYICQWGSVFWVRQIGQSNQILIRAEMIIYQGITIWTEGNLPIGKRAWKVHSPLQFCLPLVRSEAVRSSSLNLIIIALGLPHTAILVKFERDFFGEIKCWISVRIYQTNFKGRINFEFGIYPESTIGQWNQSFNN